MPVGLAADERATFNDGWCISPSTRSLSCATSTMNTIANALNKHRVSGGVYG